MTRETGAPILKDTPCRVGMHVFIWAGGDTLRTEPLYPAWPCDCGMYTWEEWNEELAKAKGK